MLIIIEYESSWRNSFLDGSNNESIPPKGRKYIASKQQLQDPKVDNFKMRNITKDTVMGILNRLIGDQRKLYQARQSQDYYFKEIDIGNILTEQDICDECIDSNELVYLRNMSDSYDQKSFAGMIKSNDPVFIADFSKQLWGVLWLDIHELVNFILNGSYLYNRDYENIKLEPQTVCDQLAMLNAGKISIDGQIEQCLSKFNQYFPNNTEYKEVHNECKQFVLYRIALFLNTQRLKHDYNNIEEIIFSKSGKSLKQYTISGIGPNSFTVKDFMKNYTTGGKKKVFGNPYMLTKTQTGVGELHHMLTKADGTLTIHLKIDREKAIDLQNKIENAGVSSFYLGKKGLAYVKDIRI